MPPVLSSQAWRPRGPVAHRREGRLGRGCSGGKEAAQALGSRDTEVRGLGGSENLRVCGAGKEVGDQEGTGGREEAWAGACQPYRQAMGRRGPCRRRQGVFLNLEGGGRSCSTKAGY